MTMEYRKMIREQDGKQVRGEVSPGGTEGGRRPTGFIRKARPLFSELGGRLRPEWVAGLNGIHNFYSGISWKECNAGI